MNRIFIILFLMALGAVCILAPQTVYAQPPGPAELSLTKTQTPAGTITAGELVTYTVTVINNGPDIARSVTIEDDLPTGFTLVAADVTRTGAGPALCGGTTCQVGDMAVGETVTVVITALVDAELPEGVATNTATVFHTSPEIDTTDNSDTADTTIRTNAVIRFVKRSLYSPIWINTLNGTDDVTYVLTVQNDGPSDARSVTLIDTLPTGLVFSQQPIVNSSYALGSLASPCGSVINLNEITCSLGTIPAGETLELILTARTQTNSAADLCDQLITNSADLAWEDSVGANTISRSTNVRVRCQAELELAKHGPDVAAVGDSVTYVMTATNTGLSPIPAGQLVLTEQFPSGLSGATITNQTGACNFTTTFPTLTSTGDLIGGRACTVTVEATVTEDACPTRQIFNEAELHDQNGNLDQAAWLTQVDCETTLEISKEPIFDPTDELIAGTDVGFVIEIVNTGDVTAFSPEITDNVVPTFLNGAQLIDFAILDTSFGADLSALFIGIGECTSGGFCNLPDIPPGEAILLGAAVRIDSDQILSVPLIQQACVEADNADLACDEFIEPILAAAELTIEKADMHDPAFVNTSASETNDVTYIISVGNNGPSDAQDVVLTDTLPTGMERREDEIFIVSYASDLGPSSCSGSTTITCELGTIPAGETVSIILSASVEDTSLCNTEVTNNVEVSWSDDFGGDTIDTTSSTDLICQGNLGLHKTGPAEITALDAFSYTLKVENTGTGPIPAGQLTLTDTLPTGISLTGISQSGACDFVGPTTGSGTLVWTNDSDIPADALCTVELQVSSSSEVCPSGLLSNVAQVTDQDNHLDQASWTTAVDCATALEVTKTQLGPVIAGTTTDFEILIENTGDVTAFDVELTDHVDLFRSITGIQIIHMEALDYPIGACTNGGFCNLGDLEPGDTAVVIATVEVDSDYFRRGRRLMRQVACAEANNAEISCDGIVSRVGIEFDLNIEKDDLGTQIVAGGDPGQYVITVWNNGPSDARRVIIEDIPATGFSLDGSLTQGNRPMRCIGDSCLIPRIPAGESVEIYATLNAAPDAPLGEDLPVNEACIVDTRIGLPDDIPICDAGHTTVVALADLALLKLGTATAIAGEQISYGLFIINNGPSDAQDVYITDFLPDGVSILSLPGGCSETAPDSGVIICGPFGPIPPGELGIGEIVVRADNDIEPGTSLENYALILSETTEDPNPLDNFDSADTSILGRAELELTKVQGAPTGAVNAGELVSYTITVVNGGPSVAQNVDIKDDLPTGFSLVSATVNRDGSGPSLCGGTVCQVGDMAVEETVTVTIVAYVDPSLSAGTIVENTATVFSDSLEDNLDDNSDTVSTEIETRAALRLSKRDFYDRVWINTLANFDDVTYVLSVRNNGPSDAQNVVVTDTLPDGMVLSQRPTIDGSFAPLPQANICSPNGSNPIVCTLGTVPAGQTVTIFLTARVTNATAAELCDAPVTNHAEMTWDDSQGDNTRTSNATTGLFCQAEIDLKKKGPSTAAVGDTITYVMTATNTGPSPIPAEQLRLEDQIPAGLLNATVVDQTGNCNFTTELPTLISTDELRAGRVCTVTIEATVTEEVCPAGLIFNEAQLHDEDDNIDQAVWLTQIDCGTVLNISKEPLFDQGDVIAGTTVEYAITIENIGLVTAFHPELTDSIYAPFPTGAQIVNMRIDSVNFDYDVTGGECINTGYCNLPDIPVEGIVTVIATVQIDADQQDGLLDQRACVEADNATQACDGVEVPIVGDADLTLTKQDFYNQVFVNTLADEDFDDATYVITIRNEGISDAQNVIFTDYLPEGLRRSESVQVFPSYAPGPTTDACEGKTEIVCELGTLPAGETIEIIIVARVTDVDLCDTENVENKAEVTWEDSFDGGSESDRARTDFICQGDLDLIKDGPAEITALDAFSYVLTLANNGISPIPAGEITLVDTLPAGVTLTGSDQTGECEWISAPNSSGGLTWINGETMPAGEICTLELQVIAEDVCGNGVASHYIVNNAQVADLDSNLDQAIWLTQVDCATTLGIRKSGPTQLVAGTQVAYQIEVENTGDVTAFDVELTDAVNVLADEIPDGAQIVSVAADGYPAGTCTDSGFCNLGNLAPNTIVNITVLVQIGSNTAGSILIQQACVQATNADTICDEVSGSIEAEFDIRIEKDDLGKQIVAGGEPIVYVITVWNDGPSDAYNIEIDDDTSADLDLVGSLEPGNQPIDCSGDDCTIPLLRAGESIELYAPARAEADASGEVENKVCAEVEGWGEVCDSSDTDVITVADLVLNKSATPTVEAGEQIAYTLTIFNSGPSYAQQVALTDTLPSGVVYDALASSDSCTEIAPNSGVISCTVGTLARFGSASRTIVVTVANDVPSGTSLENSAVVTSSTDDNDELNNHDDADTNVIGRAELVVTKTGPDMVIAGELIEYTVEVVNNGPSVAEFVDVKDDLPTGVTLLSATIERTGSDPALCGSTICQVGTMAVDERFVVTVLAEVDSNIAEGTVLANTATVFSTSPENDRSDNSMTIETVVQTQADLNITKTGLSDPVAPLEGFLYEIVVHNAGPSDAQNVVISDILDANVSFDGASYGCNASGDPGTQTTVGCTIGTIPAGDHATILLGVRTGEVPSGTILHNEATVSSSTSDPSTPNVATVATTVEELPSPSADLSLSKTTQVDQVIAGETIAYELVVNNAGPQTATNVQLLERIPSGAHLVSINANNPADDNTFCSQSGTCFLGTLLNGASATVAVVLSVEANYTGDILVNQAHVSADQSDPNAGNNIASVSTGVVSRATLAIEKAVLVDPVVAGSDILYQLTVRNSGPSVARNVTLVDGVPEQTLYAGASPECNEAGNQVTCTLGDLRVDESKSLVIQVTAKVDVPESTTIVNNATVSAENADDANATVESVAIQSPLNPTNLQISKRASLETVVAGTTLSYILEVTNHGPAPATDVLVVDGLPSGTEVTNVNTTRGVCNESVVCQLSSLAVGETATIQIDVTVDGTVQQALTNLASVSAANPETYPDDNQATVVTNVSQQAQLSMSKAGPETMVAGAGAMYEIYVSNAGPSSAYGVTVLDPLPGQLDLAATTIATSQGSCVLTGNELNCNLGEIPAGGAATVDISVQVQRNATGSIENTALAFSPTDTKDGVSLRASRLSTDPIPPNVNVYRSSTIANVITIAEQPVVLVLTKSGKSSVVPGDPFQYILHYQNRGGDGSDVVIQEMVPQYTTFDAANSTTGWQCEGNEIEAGTICLYALGDVVAGASGELIFAVNVTDDIPTTVTEINNQAILRSTSANAPNAGGQNVAEYAPKVLHDQGPTSLDETQEPGAGRIFLPLVSRRNFRQAPALFNQMVTSWFCEAVTEATSLQPELEKSVIVQQAKTFCSQ